MIYLEGVKASDACVRYVQAVRDAGLRRAVVSSSANCRDIRPTAHIEDLFEVRIDGITVECDHVGGEPAPHAFLAGAKSVGLEAARAVVFEDALAGAEAGRAGKFEYVVGVDRVGQADGLGQRAADVVVKDLAELLGKA
jgi:HAD superfamily hydrolase (TIGR01509 family)